MHGFKIAPGKIGKSVRAALARDTGPTQRQGRTPTRIPAAKRCRGPDIGIATERRHFTNVLKTVVYHAESDLTRTLAPHYAQSDEEGRAIVATALKMGADIVIIDKKPRVTLKLLMSPHHSRAIAYLREHLDATDTTSPGTDQRLCYAVGEVP